MVVEEVLKAREARALEKGKEDAAAVGTGVTARAQDIFDALRKTYARRACAL